ncbi:MAG: RNA polymerase sigma-70 factor [Candidatus Cryptobacteroides sp.]
MKFDEYYRQYYGRIVAFARSYVNDDMVAQDIAADSMVKLWIHLKEDPDDEIHNWLFVIVRNLCLDYLKHQRIKQKALAEVSLWKIQDLDFKISSLDGYEHDSVVSGEIRGIVNKVLNEQTAKTRSIFIKSRVYGKKNCEIAESMGLSEKNIEYHITKVLKALKIALKDYLKVFIMFLLFDFFIQMQDKNEEVDVYCRHFADESTALCTKSGLESRS